MNNIKIDQEMLRKIDPMDQLKGMNPTRIIKQDWMGTVVLFQGGFGEMCQVILPTSAVKVTE